MKDSNFTIKIHDFLSKKTLQDEVVFTDKFSTKLPQLLTGLSCTVVIQAGDEKTFMITIPDLSYETTNNCDVCAEDATVFIEHNSLFYKFFGDCDEELLGENEINFSSQDGYLDLEDILVQEILLNQEIKNMCNTCSKNQENNNDIIESGNKIIRKTNNK